MNTIIEKIRAEIERRIKKYDAEIGNDWSNPLVKKMVELNSLLSFLDTLQEQPVCEDAEKELERFLVENVGVCVEDDTDKVRIFDVDTGKGDIDITYTDLKDIARHFYELGRSEKPNDLPTNLDEDIITIHLGKILPDEQYDEVVRSVVAFMNQRWPNCKVGVDN